MSQQQRAQNRQSTMKKRIAIIGAGPSGLSLLNAFKTAAETGTEIPEITCFEKQSDWGGLWTYDWRTGTDKHGEACHASMYRNLWSNGPKECLEMADHTFDQHFGQAIASYPPRPVLRDYILGRAEKRALRRWIRFETVVRMVTYSEVTGKFTVTVQDLSKDKTTVEEFDHVAVASGHFSVPNIPDFEGIGEFKGRVLHSHEFRDAAEFKDQNVLILGRSFSAEDIASQCYKYGAKFTAISYRAKPIGYAWPEGILEVPLLQHVSKGNVCTFLDGSSREFDAIIVCTGYKHHFPFLSEELRLKTANRFWLPDLYKGVLWQKNPKLAYLGMQNQFYTFFMFDVQAWFVRDVWLGRIELPSYEKMVEEGKPWQEREAKMEALDAGYTVKREGLEPGFLYQSSYIQHLLDQSDYPKFDFEALHTAFREWEKYKAENMMTFRDHAHRSAMTGKMGAKRSVTWLKALDDSLEAFLRDATPA